ncbi:hypothetical protein C0993_002303 [Termitomyces sp. T159_Od127]|nr:hypothetical protein C0993_002303 [Termitomyces sp. T159_Od127]
MHAFHAHGDACERAEAHALHLALHPPAIAQHHDADDDWDAPMRVYTETLDALDRLYAAALELEEAVLDLTGSPEAPAREDSDARTAETAGHCPAAETETEAEAEAEAEAQAQILGVFRACLPVLRARIANLAMAQELVDGARENTSISLRMESLGLLD